jgi:hypothetical protein
MNVKWVRWRRLHNPCQMFSTQALAQRFVESHRLFDLAAVLSLGRGQEKGQQEGKECIVHDASLSSISNHSKKFWPLRLSGSFPTRRASAAAPHPGKGEGSGRQSGGCFPLSMQSGESISALATSFSEWEVVSTCRNDSRNGRASVVNRWFIWLGISKRLKETPIGKPRW